jgi:hypothetical protein
VVKTSQPFIDDDHDCAWDEVTLDATDEDEEGNLRAGDRVLLPCRTCGRTPLEALDDLNEVIDRTAKAFAAYAATRGQMLLYHWSPATRRKQIMRHGLLPRRRPSTTLGRVGGRVWRAPYICFGDTPSWAWALSGGMPHTVSGEWDLWCCWLDRLTEPLLLTRTDSNGVHEIRTDHRVFKRDLWYVGTRVKP